ncbi:MAG: FAD-dependent oxidoreductase, partial [Oscillospiraceae bacterium]
MKVVIVGGVAGGATAAARLRRLDEGAEIVLLERGDYISYANCGLPYYIGGEITDKRDLTLQTPKSFFSRFRIDVRVGNEALAIDPAGKTVSVRRVATGETYTEHYDKLILSPGAEPVRPQLPGVDDPRIFTLRTIPDTLKIREQVVKSQ